MKVKTNFNHGWTATVSETVSNAESRSTIRHYLSELAETLPLLAFTHAVEAGLTRLEQTSYRTKIPALNPSFEGGVRRSRFMQRRTSGGFGAHGQLSGRGAGCFA